MLSGSVVAHRRLGVIEDQRDSVLALHSLLVNLLDRGIHVERPPGHRRLDHLHLAGIVVEDEAGVFGLAIQLRGDALQEAAQVFGAQAHLVAHSVGRFDALDRQHPGNRLLVESPRARIAFGGIGHG